MLLKRINCRGMKPNVSMDVMLDNGQRYKGTVETWAPSLPVDGVWMPHLDMQEAIRVVEQAFPSIMGKDYKIEFNRV